MLVGMLVAGAGVAVLAWLLFVPWLRARRRRALRALPLPSEWVSTLDRNVPLRRRMPPAYRARLDGLVQVFVAEKSFVGCDGLVITDEIRVTIAAYACVLLVGRRDAHYDALQSILVYPTPFWVDEEFEDAHGLVTRRRRMLSGQAWDAARVIVSWEDVIESIEEPDSGYNVVIHEFAHHLDADGLPGVPDWTPASGTDGIPGTGGWADALAGEYDRLVAALDAGTGTFLDPYAAEDEMEFFAVASEEFFERPAGLAAAEPRLYALLAACYGLDPAAWHGDA